VAIHKKNTCCVFSARRWPLSGERITTGFTVSTKAFPTMAARERETAESDFEIYATPRQASPLLAI
jgi:hypothetical protein